MRPLKICDLALLPLLTLAVLLAGCAGEEKKSPPFFTSGNPEADQRAEQRMAKQRQLKAGKNDNAANASSKSGDQGPARAPQKETLYARLGGQPAIKSIVDDFVTRAMADPRVNWDRKGITQGGFFNFHRNKSVEWHGDVDTLKLHMTQFLCLVTGGPTTYQGKEMKQAHAGMHITNAEFDAAVGDLKSTLDKLQIPDQEQKELLAIVESTRQQVVEER